jgi:hypothetical protein
LVVHGRNNLVLIAGEHQALRHGGVIDLDQFSPTSQLQGSTLRSRPVTAATRHGLLRLPKSFDRR